MRHLFRLAIPVLAAAAIVLGGASSALAAATPSSASLDATWCYEDGSTRYCYDIDGTMHYLDTTAGSSVTVHPNTRTTVYESGEYAGETMSVRMLRDEFQADGTVVTQSITNTRSTVGDEPCVYRLVLRLVDYEAVVYQVTSTAADRQHCGPPPTTLERRWGRRSPAPGNVARGQVIRSRRASGTPDHSSTAPSGSVGKASPAGTGPRRAPRQRRRLVLAGRSRSSS
jgi:hypothetical protein